MAPSAPPVFAAIDLGRISSIEPDLLELLPHDIAARHRFVPLYVVDNETVVVAMDDPTNQVVFEDIEWLTGWRTQPVFSDADTLLRTISRVYGTS